MKTLLKIVLGIVFIAVIGIGILVATFNADRYRPQIAAEASKTLGREVKFGGPISLGLSWTDGLNLVVNDVSVANPAWASRPVMAKVGKLTLGVALPPLLRHELDVTSLSVSNADVQLETNAAGQSNWEMGGEKAKPAEPSAPAANEKAGKGTPLAFHVGEIAVRDTRLALRDKTGKTTEVKADKLTFAPKGRGMELRFDGSVNGNMFALDVTGRDPLEQITKAKWPFDAEIRYAPYTITAEGELNHPAKSVALDSYTLKAGGTAITGKLEVAYGGARPAISGTLNSDRLDPADLKPAPAAAEAATPATEGKGEAKSEGGQKRLFSAEPLKLDGLKAADAKLDIAISELPVGPSALKHLKTRLDLTGGRLLLSPLKAEVAGTQAEGQLKLDASTMPAQFSTILKAYQLDLAQLVSLGGLKSFLESKGDADMDIVTSGNSLHDFASGANGQINLVMAGGSVSKQVLGDIAGGLLNVFAPGSGQLAKPELDCAVAHFKIVSGVIQTDGLLIDTGQATVAGAGSVNLRDETINMLLYTRPKVGGISSTLDQAAELAPPVRITGSLANPRYAPDPAAAAQKIAGLFGLGAPAASGVPEIIKQAGQNACEYTLKHPQEAKAQAIPAPVEKAVEKVKEKARDLGGKALKGIGNLLGR